MGQIKLSRTLKSGYNSASITPESKPPNLPSGVTFSIDNPCTCNVCGLHLNILTHYHAEQHGYKDKYALIEAGHVSWKRKPPTYYSFNPRVEITVIACGGDAIG